MINRVFLCGNLTRDPELKAAASGTSVMTFGLAVNDRRKQGDEWVDVPNFFDCVMFGSRAEKLRGFLAKGIKVSIEGRLRWSQFDAKNGEKRSKVEILVDEVEIMRENRIEPKPQQVTATVYDSFADDDLPF